jgi:ribonucleoside-diphosphate reductase beta chain
MSEKYTVFPINYPKIWDFYKKHISSFWVVEEIRLSDDLEDWKKLNDNERHFIKNVLAFFASSDGIVNENLVANFYNEIEIAEVRQFYSIQMLIEAIHSEQYSLLIDTYISDTTEKNNLFKAIETIPAIKKKAEWAIKWIEEGNAIKNIIPKEYLDSLLKLQNEVQSSEFKDALNYLTKERPNLAQRLLAFICVEGIFFSGSFCAIYWLKARGLLPGLATANQFIARDENLHVEFAIELFKTLNLNAQISKEKVEQIVKEAVEIEKEFISESLPVSLIGMNCTLMKEYIEYVADRWLVLLGYQKIYNASNPFSFMELISVNDKTNFFESNVSSYQKASVGTKEEQRVFTLEDDF